MADWYLRCPSDFTPPGYLEAYQGLANAQGMFRGSPITPEEARAAVHRAIGNIHANELDSLRYLQCLFQILDVFGPDLVEAKLRPLPRDWTIEPEELELALRKIDVDEAVRDLPEWVLWPDGLSVFKVWLAEHFLDDFFEGLPKSVRRWEEIRIVVTGRRPPPHAVGYFAEAAQAYIHGIFRAAVILCRASLEDAIRERLRAKGGQPSQRNFSELIEAAVRLRLLSNDNGTVEAANQIRVIGNQVAHPNARVNEQTARDVLDNLGAVLAYLFREQ